MPTTFYYTGTDKNPPVGAAEEPMQGNNIGSALYAWLLLTTNPTWPAFFANGALPPGMILKEVADILGITPGSLQYILDLSKDPVIFGALVRVGEQFQEVNNANLESANRYDWPCPGYVDMLAFLKVANR